MSITFSYFSLVMSIQANKTIMLTKVYAKLYNSMLKIKDINNNNEIPKV